MCRIFAISGVARGTFKTNHGGSRFLYLRTLDRDWPLFSKKSPRVRKQRLPAVLSDAEIRALLGCVRNPIHRTCFALMYACGLRIGEAATVEIASVDLIGKGDKERRVPLPQPMLDDLRRLWLTPPEPALALP